MIGELVKTQTSDGYVLNAFWMPGIKDKAAVLHVHGYGGSFYANQFVHSIGDSISKLGYGYLTIETRGSYDQQGLQMYGRGFGRTGAYFERLEQAYLDIDAWVQFLLHQGYEQVVLQGHSLGTAKIVRYMHEGGEISKIQKLILLCPFERFALASMLTQNQLASFIDYAQEKVKQNHSDDLIPTSWGGVPMSYGTFVSWYEDTPANHCFDYARVDFESDYLHKITQPVAVIVGSNDEYFSPHSPDNFQESLQRLCAQLQQGEWHLIDGARHSFRDFEEVVAEKVKNFLG